MAGAAGRPVRLRGRFGGITAFTELLLDAAATAARATGVGIGIIIAANRTRHPMDARTLARLAAQFAGQGVVGFGLSNDERRGPAEDFERGLRHRRAGRAAAGPARRRARRPGQRHRGPGPAARRPDRARRPVGRGPEVVERLAAAAVTCEVCPSSNVALGVAPDAAAVPVRTLFEAGVPMALGADDPLLFGRRLVKQYEIARDVHGFSPPELAELARMSVLGSAAPHDRPHPPARRHRRLASGSRAPSGQVDLDVGAFVIVDDAGEASQPLKAPVPVPGTMCPNQVPDRFEAAVLNGARALGAAGATG